MGGILLAGFRPARRGSRPRDMLSFRPAGSRGDSRLPNGGIRFYRSQHVESWFTEQELWAGRDYTLAPRTAAGRLAPPSGRTAPSSRFAVGAEFASGSRVVRRLTRRTPNTLTIMSYDCSRAIQEDTSWFQTQRIRSALAPFVRVARGMQRIGERR